MIEGTTKYVRPDQLGWLRRPECDNPQYPNWPVWEMPDGYLLMLQPGEVIAIFSHEKM